MSPETFIKEIRKNFDKGLDLIKKKNKDYAGAGDPFANFRNSEVVGVSVEKGILVRLMDKVSRISNLLENDPEVIEESMEDTLIDCMNYFNILLLYRQQKQDKTELFAYKPVNASIKFEVDKEGFIG